jgi:hypothetical protein
VKAAVTENLCGEDGNRTTRARRHCKIAERSVFHWAIILHVQFSKKKVFSFVFGFPFFFCFCFSFFLVFLLMQDGSDGAR